MRTNARKRAEPNEPQSVLVGGRPYVLVEAAEYERLRARECGLPLPPADERGNRPARETLAVLLARDIIRHRKALGLSQAELARRAGIRQETLNRIEQGRHAASIPTVDKIERALRAAEDELAAAMDRAAQPATRSARRPASSTRRKRTNAKTKQRP